MADWQVGDLALCVRGHFMYPAQVVPGAVFEVEYVWHDCEDAADASHISTCLDLTGVPRMLGDIAYWAGSFRKITPGAKIEGVEERRVPTPKRVKQDA